MSSNKQLTKERIAGEREQTSTEPTARPRSTLSSGSDSRPPSGSRTRSPHVPEQVAPVEVPNLGDVVTPGVLPHDPLRRPPEPSPTRRRKIDWQLVNTRTFRARVAVLRDVLNDDRTPDCHKLVCAQERIENFDDEDELLNRLQSLETKDDPPPGSPEERDRHDEIKMLIAEALMRRTLLYCDVNFPGENAMNFFRGSGVAC